MDEKGLKAALDAAARLGAADAELVFARVVDLDVDVAKGEVETLQTAEAIGFGCRLFTAERRMGFAYSSQLDAGPGPVVEAAWQNALASDPDEHNVLPEEAAVSEDDWAEEDFASIPVAEKVAFCKELEEKTLAADKRITHVDQASYGEARSEWTIANSRGLLRRYRNASCSASVSAAAAQEGSDSEMGWEFDFGRTFKALRLEWLAERCAERATQGLGGKPCTSGAMPVVLDNYVAMQFLRVIGPAMMANNVLKGKSLFADAVGTRVASDKVSIIDQNDLDKGLNRAPFDGEGVSAKRKALIEGGMLRGFLHNSYTAHKTGGKTTANAARGGFRSIPEVGASNCYLAAGEWPQEDLLDAAGMGVFVTRAMGVHTADPVSGDFSLGASGLMIEEGRKGRPVRAITIAGNIKDLLVNVKLVGSDLRMFGSFGAPSILVSELMVAGL